MSQFNFKEIKIIDDGVDDMDIIRDIIKIEKPEDAFYIADIGDVIKRHHEWISKMPKVIPHYGMFMKFSTFFVLFLLKCIYKKINIILTHDFQILAIKCNSNPTVIKVLAALNGCFDCASKVKNFISVIKVLSWYKTFKALLFTYLYKS